MYIGIPKNLSSCAMHTQSKPYALKSMEHSMYKKVCTFGRAKQNKLTCLFCLRKTKHHNNLEVLISIYKNVDGS